MITYTNIEITCSNVIFFLFDPVFCMFPPLWNLVSGYVIKDAGEKNYESDHDSWLLNMQYPH